MKLFGLITFLCFACTEPTRLPVSDVGPKDAGDGDSGLADATAGDTGITPSGICQNRPCLTSVSDEAEWAFVSGPARSPSRCDLLEETLFVLPIDAGNPIQETIFVDAEAYDNLYYFLEAHLSAELGVLDPDMFYDTFERTDTRSYWSGRIFRAENGAYAFDLVADFYFGSPPDAAVVEEVRARLMQSFGFELSYAPQDGSAITLAEQFLNPPFPVLLPVPCAGEGCADPGAFCVVIPADTEVCGHFAEGRDVPGELAAKIRLRTIPGSYQIPRQVGSLPLRLFAGGAFGIDRSPIDASADGLVTVEDVGGYLYYHYTQRLTAGADTIELSWDLNSSRSPQIFREPFLTDLPVYGLISSSQMPDGRIIGSSCTATGLSRFFARGELANGDFFRFSYRHRIPFAGSGPLFLTGAEVTLGGQTAVVDDYFQLTYAGSHHNWNNQFVVVFDQPLTYMGHDVYGVWIDEPGTDCCPVDAIHTLDASHQKLDQLDVISYIRSPTL